MTNQMMTLEEAAEIVIELAEANILTDDIVEQDQALQEQQERQQEALNTVHDHFVNNVWDGTDTD